MSVRSNSTDKPSEEVMNASNINADEIVANELSVLPNRGFGGRVELVWAAQSQGDS